MSTARRSSFPVPLLFFFMSGVLQDQGPIYITDEEAEVPTMTDELGDIKAAG